MQVTMACKYQWQCLSALIFMLLASSSHVMARTINEASMTQRHELWMARYGRVYADDAEKESRFKIFKDNVEYIESSNAAGDKPFKLSINAFADQTNEESSATRKGLKKAIHEHMPTKATPFRYENVSSVPSNVDWRRKGAVTPIKDQGRCGSCWAFSTVGAVEGHNKLRTGKLISLSEQELVDCDTESIDSGCDGGDMKQAFRFIILNKGIASEARYPYKGANETCNAKREASHAAKIRGYEVVPSYSEAALLKAVANQPVSVALDAGGPDFQFYSSGVFTGSCGTSLDHAVTAIGYGVSGDGIKYWLLKNSWGTAWGEDGFMRIQRDVRAKEGLCGIAMDSSYPIA